MNDLPDPRRVGDARIAPVPAVAIDLAFSDEEERHRPDERVLRALAELEVDGIGEENAILVASDLEMGELGFAGERPDRLGDRRDPDARQQQA